MSVYTFRESELQLTGRSELVVKLSMCSICSMTYLGGRLPLFITLLLLRESLTVQVYILLIKVLLGTFGKCRVAE